MIKGDSRDYDLLYKWTKGFDCNGYKSCELEYVKDWDQKLLWITFLTTISTLALILTVI